MSWPETSDWPKDTLEETFHKKHSPHKRKASTDNNMSENPGPLSHPFANNNNRNMGFSEEIISSIGNQTSNNYPSYCSKPFPSSHPNLLRNQGENSFQPNSTNGGLGGAKGMNLINVGYPFDLLPNTECPSSQGSIAGKGPGKRSKQLDACPATERVEREIIRRFANNTRER